MVRSVRSVRSVRGRSGGNGVRNSVRSRSCVWAIFNLLKDIHAIQDVFDVLKFKKMGTLGFYFTNPQTLLSECAAMSYKMSSIYALTPQPVTPVLLHRSALLRGPEHPSQEAYDN